MAAPITDINQLDLDATYTVADYLSWQFDELVQLVKGKVLKMSPSPQNLHQALHLQVVLSLGAQLKGHPCQIRYAPFDVYLPVREGAKPTIVIPDVLIACDLDKLKDRGYYGAPNWVCEIVSPGSFKLDTVTKKQLYEEAGVGEYTILYPGDKVVQVYRLSAEGTYGTPDIYSFHGQEWEISTVPGVKLTYNEIFGEPEAID